MIKTLRFALAAPLALVLAACNSGTEEVGDIEGEAVAAVPAPEGVEWSETVTVTDADGYMIGNPDAPIKLVEYASLTCPTCARFSEEGVEPLIEDYVSTGRVSFELRNQIHGPHDLTLATLVRCGADEAFHPLSDQVWANLQQLLGPIFENTGAVEQALNLPPDQRLVRLAEIGNFYDFFAARGLSEDQARQCLADASAYETIAENSDTQSAELEITGTPTFLINGQKVEGANTWTQLEPVLQRAGAR